MSTRSGRHEKQEDAEALLIGDGKPTKITGRSRSDVRTIKRCMLAIVLALAVAIAYLAQQVIVPVLVAILLALLLSPIVTFMQRLRIPRVAGSLLTVAAVIAALVFGVASLATPARQWVAHAPTTFQTIQQRFNEFRQPIRQAQEASKKIEELTQSSAPTQATVANAQPSLLGSIASNTPAALESVAAVLLLVYFFLSSGDSFLRRMVEIAPRLREKRVIVAIAREVQDEMSRYLLTVSLINLGLGIATTLLMTFLGLPNPLLWGAVAALFNFAPYVGPACTGLALALAGFATFDTLGQALLIPAAFFALATVEGQLITPTIIGHRLSLNPTIVFIWLLVWGALWGVVGLLLAGPMLACFRIVCEHVESMRPIYILIGGEAAPERNA